jgi:acyl transferase domain-containing protein
MHDMHAVMGAHRWSVPAGRIAHLLDLRGPSFGVEATCGSALVAVHLACQALRLGEIETAIVGGANLLMSHEDRSGFRNAGIISPTFRCRFGDQHADGYVPAEGSVTLVLKPLADAVAAGDRVYATIVGSAVRGNGRQADSAGGTGTAGQEDVLRAAFDDAGITPADVDYVEAHGPGTPAGDAVELTALRRVLGTARERDRPCLVGSVKSNIGHTEAAAGLVGLLKAALAIQHRRIPPTLHVRQPADVLRDDDVPIELPATGRPWPEADRLAFAGVTSLGMFGIGAHAVLTEPPRDAGGDRLPTPATQAPPEQPLLLPLSAHDPAALRALASAYADTVATASNPADVCFSAATRRTHLPCRVAVTGRGRTALADALREVGAGSSPGMTEHLPERRPKVVFVFSGQGSQWHGMGRDLLATEAAFTRAMRECDAAIHAERGWSLIERLHDETPLTSDDEIQPALWAMQVSLAATWRQWGVHPDLVIGHSMGEVAAATVAGALTPRDGAAVICRRSALVRTLPDPGAMVAVGVGEQEANAAIGELAGQVNVAVINGAHASVLAGSPDALSTVTDRLAEGGAYCRPVRAGYASHSPHVEPLRDDLVRALGDLDPRPGQVAMWSTALDRPVSGDELDAEYWMANLRRPVRFSSAVDAALRDREPVLFVEISPHPVLLPAIEDEGAATTVTPSLVRGRPELETLLANLGAVYASGGEPDWASLYDGARFVPPPSYPWQRTRYWVPRKDRTATLPPASPQVPVSPGTRLSVRPIPPQTVPALAEHIARMAAEVLGTGSGAVDQTRPLATAGLDSLFATTLAKRLAAELDVRVPVHALLGDRPVHELAGELLARRRRPSGRCDNRKPTTGEYVPAVS